MYLIPTTPAPARATAGPVLRDIHLPPAPSWWPPAPGWWLIGLVALLAILAACWFGQRYRVRLRGRRQLIAELDGLASDYAHDGDATILAARLHQLLRRVARRQDPATTQQSGSAWHETLARVPVDSATLNRLLALDDAMYRAQSDLDVAATVSAARSWLQRASRSRAWKASVEGARHA